MSGAPTPIHSRLRRLIVHPVGRNVVGLYGVQLVGYVLPLITFPYLARVLRPQTFGLVIFAQSFGLWASLVVEYGFNYSATRAVARGRDQEEEVSRIAAEVLGAKLLLLSVILLVALGAGFTVSMFRDHPIYLLLSIPQILALGFSPFWYFQGTENMLPALGIEVIARLSATICVFCFVHSPLDGWKVLAIQGSGGCLSSILQMLLMYREIPFWFPSWSGSAQAIGTSWNLFLFRSTYSILTTANAFILGLVALPSQVALYGAGERISKALQGLGAPITQAVYPRVTNLFSQNPQRAARVAKLTLVFSTSVGVALGIFLALFAPITVNVLLGPGYEGSIRVLQIFALLLPVSAVNTGLIMQWMLPLGMDKTVSMVIAAAIGLNIAAATLLGPKFGHLGMAVSVLTSQVVMMFLLFAVLFRRKPFAIDDLRIV